MLSTLCRQLKDKMNMELWLEVFWQCMWWKPEILKPWIWMDSQTLMLSSLLKAKRFKPTTKRAPWHQFGTSPLPLISSMEGNLWKYMSMTRTPLGMMTSKGSVSFLSGNASSLTQITRKPWLTRWSMISGLSSKIKRVTRVNSGE